MSKNIHKKNHTIFVRDGNSIRTGLAPTTPPPPPPKSNSN